MKNFLKTKGNTIVNSKGKKVFLRGINLGGWLMKEAYFMNSPNLGEHKFKRVFEKALGKKAFDKFSQLFRDNFIVKSDVDNVRRLGFNCFRLPFHYNLIEEAPYKYNMKGVKYLDNAIKWAKANKLYVILDMHAAPGAQNADWHSDSTGKALFWTNKTYRKRALKLWQFIADRYKNEPAVAGYDILNEAVLGNARLLNSYYKEAIKHIREVDQNHILFIEGNFWATNIKCLDRFDDDNYVISIHSYEPLAFTFNFRPHLKYPSHKGKFVSNYSTLKKHIQQYAKFSQQRKVPIFVGEFGINCRGGLYGEDKWLEDKLRLFNKYGFHWTYWTYKAIKNSEFPDGIYSYYEDPPWVNRAGPLKGWETYHLHWRKHQAAMAKSWQTKAFEKNTVIIKALQKYAK